MQRRAPSRCAMTWIPAGGRSVPGNAVGLNDFEIMLESAASEYRAVTSIRVQVFLSTLTFAARSYSFKVQARNHIQEGTMGLLDGALGDMAGSLLGGKSGGVEQLLGGLLGNAAGKSGSSQTALLQMAMALVQQQGGIGGLLQKLQSGGLGDIAKSWVSTGANASISPTQLESALGSEAVSQAAAHAGVDPSQAMGGLAAMLPQLIDKLTPDGDVTPGSSAMLTQVLGMLKGS